MQQGQLAGFKIGYLTKLLVNMRGPWQQGIPAGATAQAGTHAQLPQQLPAQVRHHQQRIAWLRPARLCQRLPEMGGSRLVLEAFIVGFAQYGFAARFSCRIPGQAVFLGQPQSSAGLGNGFAVGVTAERQCSGPLQVANSLRNSACQLPVRGQFGIARLKIVCFVALYPLRHRAMQFLAKCERQLAIHRVLQQRMFEAVASAGRARRAHHIFALKHPSHLGQIERMLRVWQQIVDQAQRELSPDHGSNFQHQLLRGAERIDTADDDAAQAVGQGRRRLGSGDELQLAVDQFQLTGRAQRQAQFLGIKRIAR